MKKKYRDIVVDDVKYAWMITGKGEDNLSIKVMKDKKVIIMTEVNNVDGITPKHVADLIKVWLKDSE